MNWRLFLTILAIGWGVIGGSLGVSYMTRNLDPKLGFILHMAAIVLGLAVYLGWAFGGKRKP